MDGGPVFGVPCKTAALTVCDCMPNDGDLLVKSDHIFGALTLRRRDECRDLLNIFLASLLVPWFYSCFLFFCSSICN